MILCPAWSDPTPGRRSHSGSALQERVEEVIAEKDGGKQSVQAGTGHRSWHGQVTCTLDLWGYPHNRCQYITICWQGQKEDIQ